MRSIYCKADPPQKSTLQTTPDENCSANLNWPLTTTQYFLIPFKRKRNKSCPTIILFLRIWKIFRRIVQTGPGANTTPMDKILYYYPKMLSISKKMLWYKVCLCSGQYHERKNCQKLLIPLFILIFVFIPQLFISI